MTIIKQINNSFEREKMHTVEITQTELKNIIEQGNSYIDRILQLANQNYHEVWFDKSSIAKNDLDRSILYMIVDDSLSSRMGGKVKFNIIGWNEKRKDWVFCLPTITTCWHEKDGDKYGIYVDIAKRFTVQPTEDISQKEIDRAIEKLIKQVLNNEAI